MQEYGKRNPAYGLDQFGLKTCGHGSLQSV